MDARSLVLALAFVGTLLPSTYAQQVMPMSRQIGAARARAESQNFVVFASTQQMADQVAQTAESYRNELANHWLGRTLPTWNSKCPIVVVAGDQLGAGGETTFTLSGGTIVRWQMRVQGTFERILDSVLPHEITHTVLATHFAQWDKTVPRWADEGASTTVEHMAERSKNDRMLTEFLTSGRGIPFATLFSLKEYPPDILPLYAQGYSLSMFLIGQGGPRKFVQFLESGVQTEDWIGALRTHYGYAQLGRLQTAWNQWVADGGGEVEAYTAVAMNQAAVTLASANVPTSRPTPNELDGMANGDKSDIAFVPSGRLAVSQTPATSIEISDGFEPVEPRTNRENLAASLPTDPQSLTAIPTTVQDDAPKTAVGASWYDRNDRQPPRTSTPAAKVAGAAPDFPKRNPTYQFQPIGPSANRTSALQTPYQGIGSSPASIQFGPAEPLIR